MWHYSVCFVEVLFRHLLYSLKLKLQKNIALIISQAAPIYLCINEYGWEKLIKKGEINNNKKKSSLKYKFILSTYSNWFSCSKRFAFKRMILVT